MQIQDLVVLFRAAHWFPLTILVMFVWQLKFPVKQQWALSWQFVCRRQVPLTRKHSAICWDPSSYQSRAVLHPSLPLTCWALHQLPRASGLKWETGFSLLLFFSFSICCFLLAELMFIKIWPALQYKCAQVEPESCCNQVLWIPNFL